MKPTTQKFFAELNKKRPTKINLALTDDASQIMDELYNFRLQVSELSSRNNQVMEEYESVLQKFSDLSSEGESWINDYNSILSRADSFKDEVENVANDLGLNTSYIPYFSELQNNLNDTKEDEEAVVFWVENWKNLSQ